MPPKKRKVPKIKQEPTDHQEIITKDIKIFSSTTNPQQTVKHEKEEQILILESYSVPNTFNEDLCIKQEEPVEFTDVIEGDFEDTEVASNENEGKNPIKAALELLDTKTYTCKTCDATFKSRSALTNHKKLHTDPLKCKKCSKVFKIKKNFDTHKCTYECQICTKAFFRNDNLTQHMNYVHGKWKKSELFTCDCCGKGFKYKKSLVCHMKQHMQVKPLICNLCNQGFSVKNTFKQHMLTHTGKIACKVCSKWLKPSAMYYHMKQAHETSRKFQCDICDASFKTRGDLNTHQGTHNKKHECSVCHKKFSRNYKLKIHFQIHENPKMYECKKCFKVLTRKDTLEMHEKWCGETFYCGNCDFTTNFPKRLLTHEAKCIKKDKMKRSKRFKDFEDTTSDDGDNSEEKEEEEVKEQEFENDLFCNHCKKVFDTKKELSEHIKNIVL